MRKRTQVLRETDATKGSVKKQNKGEASGCVTFCVRAYTTVQIQALKTALQASSKIQEGYMLRDGVGTTWDKSNG